VQNQLTKMQLTLNLNLKKKPILMIYLLKLTQLLKHISRAILPKANRLVFKLRKSWVLLSGIFFEIVLPSCKSKTTKTKLVSYTYEYPRPALTVDAAVFREVGEGGIELLLIQRDRPPFEGGWALPGGFVDMDETLEEAVVRELEEETSLIGIHLEQLKAFSAIDRDPRGRTVSVVFWGILKDDQQANAGDDARNTKWFLVNQLPELAFDHAEVVKTAIQKLNTFLESKNQ